MAQGTARDVATSHYMVMFATQLPANPPRFAHSFAAFGTGAPPDDPDKALRAPVLRISWLPSTMIIRLLAHPEPGTNFDVARTIEWALREPRACVSAWGPYEIEKALYDSFLRRAQELNDYLYQAINRDFGLPKVTNCIHALSDIDLFPGPLKTGLARGEEASGMIVERCRPWIINPAETHGWVMDAMGLSHYPIALRTSGD